MADMVKIDLQTSWSTNDPVFGTTIYFDENEVLDCKMTCDAQCEILESLKQAPQVYDWTRYDMPTVKADHFKITLKILHNYSTTKTKIEQIINCKNLIKVYKNYHETPATYTKCFVDPVYSEKYFSGYQGAKYVTELTFYETYEYKVDGNNYLSCGISITPEVVIDPDGKNIKLDGKKDVISISNISQKMDIEPERSGIIENNDIQITINNQNQCARLYNNDDTETGFNPFRTVFGKIYEQVSANCVAVYLGETDYLYGYTAFWAGDLVTLAGVLSGVSFSEEQVISSVAITTRAPLLAHALNVAELTFGGTLVNTYAQNDVVQTWSFVGKKVRVDIRVENEYQPGSVAINTYTVFKGRVRETPQVDKNTATFTVEPLMTEILKKPLLIKNSVLESDALNRCGSTGVMATSKAWTTQTGSGALADVTHYAGAIPGYWQIVFSDATNFTVTGPNCSAKAGTTGGDFYDQTNATDSQIKIAAADWSGTPATADVLEFYLSVNYETKYLPEIIYDLLINVAGLTASDIDTDTIKIVGGTGQYSISFSEVQTIGEAISAILEGNQYYLNMTYDGKFKLSYLYIEDYSELAATTGDLYMPVDSSAIKPSITLNETKLNISDICNEIIIYYGYDYTLGEYQYTAKYPIADTGNRSYTLNQKKRTVEYYMPGIYTYANALNYAALNYAIYAYGQILAEASVTLMVVDKIEPGKIFYFTLDQGNMGFYVTEKEIDMMNCRINCYGMNLRKFS